MDHSFILLSKKLDGLIFPGTRSLLPRKQFCKVFCTKLLVDKKAKGRASERWLQENKALSRTCSYQGKRNVFFFFGKFDVLCFVVTTIFRIILLPYYRRNVDRNQDCFSLTEGLRNFSWIF